MTNQKTISYPWNSYPLSGVWLHVEPGVTTSWRRDNSHVYPHHRMCFSTSSTWSGNKISLSIKWREGRPIQLLPIPGRSPDEDMVKWRWFIILLRSSTNLNQTKESDMISFLFSPPHSLFLTWGRDKSFVTFSSTEKPAVQSLSIIHSGYIVPVQFHVRLFPTVVGNSS